MTIKFTATALEVDGETMKKHHYKDKMAEHIKAMLGMSLKG